MNIPGLRDLGQAEHWYQHSLTHTADSDTLGRAKTLGSLGNLAYERFDEARDAGEPGPVLLAHLNTALDRLQQALALFPADDAEDLATVHNQLGVIYGEAGDTRQALRHYQQSIAHKEARGDTYGAGTTRYNIALLLAGCWPPRRRAALRPRRPPRLRERRPRRRPGSRPGPGPHHPPRTRQRITIYKDSDDRIHPSLKAFN